MPVDTRHPRYTEYSDAWDAAAALGGSENKRLADDDYRAGDAARLAEIGAWEEAIALLADIRALADVPKEMRDASAPVVVP